MVSAYNLNSDVLGLVFLYLSGNDLVSVALVSKAFLHGVTPRLYHSLVFTLKQAKKYPKIVSPFESLLARPALGVYVRVCDISAFPLYKGHPNQLFLSECIRALDICPNLTRFKLALNVLPSFLLTLSRKEKLKELHANGSLTMEQAELLVTVKGLRVIRLDHMSWCLMNLFPTWMCVLSSTLIHLSFTFTAELNETILEEMLMHLPNLRELSIRNCVRIEHPAVFRLISHTPLLENLAVTTWENPAISSTAFGEVSKLQHLHLDTRNTFVPASVEALWCSIIAHTKACAASLMSLTLQLSDKLTLQQSTIEDIVNAHADTLTSLRFVKCGISMSSLRLICRRCKKLERLAIHIPMKELNFFTDAIAESNSMQMLIDEPDMFATRGHRPSLKHEDVKEFMTRCPKLRHIISDGTRSWKGSGDAGNLQITLERLKTSSFPGVMTFP
ncbi:hypothetical protein ACEPAH_2651 [Sanghuangporus vaninii]